MTHKNFRRLTLALSLIMLLVLQGCGFHLRGSADLPPSISPLYVQGVGPYDPLRHDLRQIFSNANIEVTDSRDQARSVLQLDNQDFERRVLSVDGQGKVVEYELHQALDFKLTDSEGKVLVNDQTVGTQRTYINPETEVLGKSEEELEMRQDMRLDIAARIVRRLQAQLR